MTYHCMTLKVCEACGTLWVRGRLSASVYCKSCSGLLEQFPDPKTRLRPGRPKKDRSVPAQQPPVFALSGGAR